MELFEREENIYWHVAHVLSRGYPCLCPEFNDHGPDRNYQYGRSDTRGSRIEPQGREKQPDIENFPKLNIQEKALESQIQFRIKASFSIQSFINYIKKFKKWKKEKVS